MQQRRTTGWFVVFLLWRTAIISTVTYFAVTHDDRLSVRPVIALVAAVLLTLDTITLARHWDRIQRVLRKESNRR